MRLQHVSVAIAPDGADAARAFYGDLLGLEEKAVLPKLDRASSSGSAPGATYELHLMRTGDEPPPSAHLCLAVDSGLAELRAGAGSRRARPDPHRRTEPSLGRSRFIVPGDVRKRRRAGRAPRLTALVGLDVGTTGVKAIAISPVGEVLAQVEHEYPLSTPQPGWAEQDPEDWWRASERALADLGWKEGDPLGFSGQMHGLVALGADGSVLRPAILWNDQRTAAECAEIEERVGLRRLIELTGNRALTGFTAPKLLWLRRHEPEMYERIAHVLLPKDYVRFRLTGERTRSMRPTHPERSSSTSPGGRGATAQMLELLELPRAWLSGRAREHADRRRR